MKRDELLKRANDLMAEYEAANAAQKKLMGSHTRAEQQAVQAEIEANEKRAKVLILESAVDIICIFARMTDAMERIADVLEAEHRGVQAAGVPKV